MNTFDILTVSLYAVVFCSFVMNVINLFQETSRLKDIGQTPLVGRSAAVIIVAALAEVCMIAGVIGLLQLFAVPINHWTVFVMFMLGFLSRNAGSYLSAWLLWSIFVRLDRRKMLNEIKDENEKALK
ncbi:hypothetical protein BCP78_0147 [Bacillus phage BCP78]|nr:hypothetical protein BCP78_0147 [Bacillus phage BCP78]YP_009783510.1 hypothetical protein QLX27_gp137 [Bacillus phage BCU4]AEW47154.1 hypothetical protein BCP78_0147 [Bacillus phage BCP78]AEW47643.1 hypothetical protein BCU4_0137 [Bacillus phage BCU4]